MKAFVGKIFFGYILFAIAATAQTTAPGTVGALPAPTPPQKRGDRPVPAPASPAPVFNTPQHAPDQILLRWKIAKQRPLGDAGALGDLGGGRPVDAALAQQRSGCPDDRQLLFARRRNELVGLELQVAQ